MTEAWTRCAERPALSDAQLTVTPDSQIILRTGAAGRHDSPGNPFPAIAKGRLPPGIPPGDVFRHVPGVLTPVLWATGYRLDFSILDIPVLDEWTAASLLPYECDCQQDAGVMDVVASTGVGACHDCPRGVVRLPGSNARGSLAAERSANAIHGQSPP